MRTNENFFQISNRVGSAVVHNDYDRRVRYRRLLLYARTFRGYILCFCEIAVEQNEAMDDEAEDDNVENEDVPEDEETRHLMDDYDIDEDTAEKAQELIEEGLDEDEAVELAGEL